MLLRYGARRINLPERRLRRRGPPKSRYPSQKPLRVNLSQKAKDSEEIEFGRQR
jgi:hypothetical protein